MLFSIAALLSLASLSAAAPPAAQSTYCYQDNLLRALQHTSTKTVTYCATPTGYPNFLAITSYPPSRLTSACSCFSRFPTDTTIPTPAPACTLNSAYNLVATTGTAPLIVHYNLVFTVSTSPCTAAGQPGFVVTNACGTAAGSAVSFNSADSTDNCYAAQSQYLVLEFKTAGGDLLQIILGYGLGTIADLTAGGGAVIFQTAAVTDVSCTVAGVCAA